MTFDWPVGFWPLIEGWLAEHPAEPLGTLVRKADLRPEKVIRKDHAQCPFTNEKAVVRTTVLTSEPDAAIVAEASGRADE